MYDSPWPVPECEDPVLDRDAIASALQRARMHRSEAFALALRTAWARLSALVARARNRTVPDPAEDCA
jgi:hypothetical protein